LIFVIKKVATLFLMPLSVGLIAAWSGLLLSRGGRLSNSKKVRVILFSGIALITVTSYSNIANVIIAPLESSYPPLTNVGAMSGIKWIAVLGGGHAPGDQLPATARLSNSSLARLVEGIRLHRQLPHTRLLLSGGDVFGSEPEAITLAHAARDLGVEADKIVIESESRDTADQAKMLRSALGDDEFILVTSASHMPRATRLCRQNGLKAFPAPTDFAIHERRFVSPADFFPRASEIMKTEMALHEYLGLLWLAAKGTL
jgi:uncharacterized SAM-binding protein YcdF (DUF218 family)